MASIIKANQLQDFGGNSIITSDGAGNLTTQKINYPAFFAYLDLDQSGITDSANTKINIDTKVFDTDNCYDNVTNYRFTPNVAGKYLFQAAGVLESSSNSGVVDFATLIYKNGSIAAQSQTNPSANYGKKFTMTLSVVLEANGTTDYFELFGYGDVASGTWTAKGQPASTRYVTYFGAYRIGS